MTFQPLDGSAGRARLRQMRTIGDEFLELMEERDRIDRRLSALMDILDPGPQRRRLPRSRLRQAAPNVLLFKGGRDAS